MQAARIVLNALRTGALPNEDVRYLAQLVSARTGLPPDQAEQRVRTQFAKAKQTMADAENTAVVELAALERAIGEVFDLAGGESLGFLTADDLRQLTVAERDEDLCGALAVSPG